MASFNEDSSRVISDIYNPRDQFLTKNVQNQASFARQADQYLEYEKGPQKR